MSELALYRKYRSRDFSEVVGQKHVVTTLTNALASGRVSHAYLFTGPRGTGKTSVARLLAKSVNCSGKIQPCNACDLCLLPLEGNMDIIEIDAASNRRIDEMRDLREKINLAPTRGKYKVYIIDEVHMLTTEAFNALLKTLEEPPAHAIFILATTEAHKLPETIISRTQRFNFRPITTADLMSHLKMIGAKEKITINDEALAILAHISQGGFRDAIGMLDQVGAAVKGPIEAEHVRMILGWSDIETVDRLSLALADRKPAEVIAQLDVMLTQGAQTGQIVLQLVERWRQFLLAAAGASNNTDETTQAIGELLSVTQIASVIEHLAAVNQAALPQVALESTLIRLASVGSRAVAAASNPPVERLQTATKPAAEAKPPLPMTSPKPTNSSEDDLWPKVLLLIKSTNNSLYALIRSCGVEIGKDSVRLVCRFNFHRDRLQESKNRQVIEAILAKVYGHKMQLSCEIENGQPAASPPETELVSSALEILGGEVVDG